MALFDLLSLAPSGRIGTIDIPATIEEIYTDTLQVTEHPVELGASITDHAFVRPREVVIRCGWTNSTLQLFLSAVSELFSGSMSASDYVSSVYSNLLALQESRQPLAITTSKRQYSNMQIIGLHVTTDQSTGSALMVQATCRQMIIVETQVTTLPAKENQANPAKTANIENAGYKQSKTFSPMSGGAVSSQGM
jgi:hypothetical protein